MFCLGMLLLVGIGCANARLVSVDRDGGVIAVPSRSSRHLRKAEEIMARESPNGYEIVKEGEQSAGPPIEHRQTSTDTRGSQVLSAMHIAPINQRTTETTTFEERKEWWIWFKKKSAVSGP